MQKCFRFNNRIDETQISLLLKTPTGNELFLAKQAHFVLEYVQIMEIQLAQCSCILSISVLFPTDLNK